MDVKTGWKTTEFWLALLAIIVGEAVAVDIIPTEGSWLKLAGLVTGVLAAIGYAHVRAKVKTPTP